MKKLFFIFVGLFIFQGPVLALGKCTSGNCIDGHGTTKWPSGNKYTGSYQNGRRNGAGVFIWAQGDRYIGEFKNGKMHGLGTYFFPNGTKYEGEYVENVRNGTGIYTWPNGARYEGQYKNGKKNGQGKFIFPSGTVMHGTWNNDTFVDSFTVTNKTANPKKFSLTVNPLPIDSKIKILQISQEYKPGIQLTVGRYELEISYPGYITKTELVDIREQDLLIPVTLELASLDTQNTFENPKQTITETEDKKAEIGSKPAESKQRKFEFAQSPRTIEDLIIAPGHDESTREQLKKANQQRIEAALQENESAQKISMIEQLHDEVAILKESFQPSVVSIKHISPNTKIYERTALVIGNGRYPLIGQLKNPENDARDISEKLRGLGFDVIMKINADEQEMESAIAEFGKRIRKGGLGLFYYAGHASQMNGLNHLIPVESRIKKPSDIKYKAVNLNILLDEMSAAKNGKNIIILDSCRNNPLPKGESRYKTAGLARTDAPPGTLIAYATSPGSVALDGKGRNGTFTKYLLSNINTPNIPIETLFKRVLQGVTAETDRQQIPWMSSSLDIDFSFATK